MNRLARIAVALTITSSIGMHIPTPNGVALAQSQNCGSGKKDNAGKVLGLSGDQIVGVAAVVVVATAVTGKATAPLLNLGESKYVVFNGQYFAIGGTPGDKRSTGNLYLREDGMLSFQGKPLSSGNYSMAQVLGTETVKLYNRFGEVVAEGSLTNEKETPKEPSSVSLLEVSSESARELIAKCPTLSQQLANEGPFTMFLPSDVALASVTLEGDKLETFLKRHIAIGRYSHADLTKLSEGAKLLTLAETELSVSHGESGDVLVAGVAVSSEAQEGSNGFSYAIPSALP